MGEREKAVATIQRYAEGQNSLALHFLNCAFVACSAKFCTNLVLEVMNVQGLETRLEGLRFRLMRRRRRRRTRSDTCTAFLTIVREFFRQCGLFSGSESTQWSSHFLVSFPDRLVRKPSTGDVIDKSTNEIGSLEIPRRFTSLHSSLRVEGGSGYDIPHPYHGRTCSQTGNKPGNLGNCYVTHDL